MPKDKSKGSPRAVVKFPRHGRRPPKSTDANYGAQVRFGMTLHAGSEYTFEDVEFLRAVERLKKPGKPPPTALDVFRLARSMGWAKPGRPERGL